MKKLFSILALAAIATQLSATLVFCDPASEIEGGFAEDWDNAVSPAVMPVTLSAMSDGDTLFIKGGVIKIKTLNDLWEITKGITIIGGFDPSLTGSDITMPTYPSATPTIFDGDVNGNGKPDAGDAEALIRINLENNRDLGVCTLQGIDMRNTYHYVEGEPTADLTTYMYKTAALRIICGTVYVKNCEIYNHFTKNRGSQSVTIVGARAHFQDCDIHHGVSMSRGGLIRLRNYFINKDTTNKVEPDLVLERCCLHDASSLGGEQCNATGVYGGALHASSGGVFAINSTFVLDSCYSKGGAIRPNASGLTLISCTLGQNFGVRATDPEPLNQRGYSYGSSIGADGDSPLRFMNTIMLDDKDGGSKKNAPLYTDDNTTSASEYFISNDYNIMGTCFLVTNGNRIEPDTKEFQELWKTNDWYEANKDNKFSSIFGDVYTKLKDNGGFAKSILPLAMQDGASVDAMQEFADQYCPYWTSVDASVDQRGYVRGKNQTCMGAAAYEAQKPSALETVKNAQGTMHDAMFNILGQSVDESYKGIVIQKGKKYLVR